MKSPLSAFIIIGLVIVALWSGTWWATTTFIPDWVQRGQFGDLFGSVNALFSGLALAGVIVAILLQQHELKLQREELKLQREEMTKSREELAEQARIQRTSLYATIAHLNTLAIEADIRAIEMESEALIPGARGRFIEEIRDAANQMREHIRELEERVAEV